VAVSLFTFVIGAPLILSGVTALVGIPLLAYGLRNP
jgi:hypothetical protein